MNIEDHPRDHEIKNNVEGFMLLHEALQNVITALDSSDVPVEKPQLMRRSYVKRT